MLLLLTKTTPRPLPSTNQVSTLAPNFLSLLLLRCQSPSLTRPSPSSELKSPTPSLRSHLLHLRFFRNKVRFLTSQLLQFLGFLLQPYLTPKYLTITRKHSSFSNASYTLPFVPDLLQSRLRISNSNFSTHSYPLQVCSPLDLSFCSSFV